MNRLAIIGAGELGEQIANLAISDSYYTVVGFFDDTLSEGEKCLDIPVVGKLNNIEALYRAGLFDSLVIAIGYKHLSLRDRLFEELQNHIPFATIVHPSCIVDGSVSMGQGVVCYPGCILDKKVVIGDNVILNNGCIVSHDSRVGRSAFLAPGVTLAGFVEVGKRVNLGIGTTVSDQVRVANDVRTGAGAVVVSDLLDKGLYFGVPAKLYRSND